MKHREPFKNPMTGKMVDPDVHNQFLFIEGRYYSAMYMLRIPPEISENGMGGDLNSLLWRDDDNPNLWCFQYRFRWYNGPRVWDSDDRKSWYSGEIEGAEEKVHADLMEMLRTLAGVTGENVDVLEIHAGVPEACEILVNADKPWLHRQTVAQE